MKPLAFPCAFALLWFGITASAPRALAGTDPEREWHTIATEHFAIHYYDPGEAMARRVARFAEEAWDHVNPLLGWEPKERVHMTIVDDVDAANGFASVMPYNAVTLFAYPPAADSTLADYDDWLKLLVFHEYTHIAHLDHAKGLNELINDVIGKTIKPNQALPRWLTEGLAVWVESNYTGAAGRLGSSRYKMYLRSAALADRLPELSELTGSPLQHPRGGSWYLYGSYLVDTIVRGHEKGLQAVADFVDRYGRRLVPYAMNILARQTTGKTFVEWYDDLREDLRGDAAETRARLEAEGLIEGTRRTAGGEFKNHARFSPDGKWLAYVRSDGHSPTQLVFTPASDLSAHQKIYRCDGGCGAFDFTRDGEHILLATERHYRRVNSYTEIAKLPFRPGLAFSDLDLLTSGARAESPHVSRDGRLLWVTRTSWGKTWLEAIDLHHPDHPAVHRYDPPGWARVSSPVPTNDGRTVFFSMHHQGNRDLYSLDVASGKTRRLTYGQSLEYDLHLTPDGRWLLYSSDATGIYDIYAREVATGQTRRLTRVLTGAFQPAVSPDMSTMVYSRWSVDGVDLYTLPFSPETAEPFAIPDPRPARSSPLSIPVAMAKQNYTPLPTMMPRTFFPSYAVDNTGLSLLGLTLSGADATGRYVSTIALEYDFSREDFAAQASLDIGTGFPDVSVSAGRYTWDRRAFFDDRFSPYREEVFYSTLGVSIPVPDKEVPVSFSAAYTADLSRAIDREETVHTPDQESPRIPREGFSTQLRLSMSLSDRESYTYSVSSMYGGSFSLTFRMRNPAIGSDISNYSVTWDASRYFPNPWVDDHVLSVRLLGGMRGGESAGNFTIGGPPEQSLVADIINQTQAGSVWLRGYETSAFSGRHYHMLTTEYRLPIFRARIGLDTLPIFFRDLWFAAFADIGAAANEPFGEETVDALRAGIGAEVRMQVELFFGLALSFRLGYARGLGEDGLDQVYLLLAGQP